jgi:transposase
MLVTSAKCQKMTEEERRRRRFSEEFRKDQVARIERGEVTIVEVSRLYEVRSNSVRGWIAKYGVKGLPDPILIRSSKDVDRLKDLEKENTRLKAALGNQHMKVVYLEELVKLAKEALGPDFEKKAGSHY